MVNVRIFSAELELEPEYDAVAVALNEAKAKPDDEPSALPDEVDKAEIVIESDACAVVEYVTVVRGELELEPEDEVVSVAVADADVAAIIELLPTADKVGKLDIVVVVDADVVAVVEPEFDSIADVESNNDTNTEADVVAVDELVL